MLTFSELWKTVKLFPHLLILLIHVVAPFFWKEVASVGSSPDLPG
jgi:hypothetical protein